MAYAGSYRGVYKEVLLRKTRTLEQDGEVAVRLGDAVRADDVVAVAKRPSRPVTVMVGAALGVPAQQVNKHLRRWAGESIQRHETLAEKKGIFGLGHKVCQSPIEGTVVSGPHSLGEVIISPPEQNVVVRAGVQGRIAGILGSRGVVIETLATVVQGIGGYQGEGNGVIQLAVGDPDGELMPGATAKLKAGQLVVGGFAGRDAVVEAVRVGVAGLVLGGLSGEAYRWLLANRPAMPVMVTDGAGHVAMSEEIFDLLRLRADLPAFLSQGQNGKPELIIGLPGPHKAAAPQLPELAPGARVRIEGGPHSGDLATIVAFPSLPRKLASGVSTAVAVLRLGDGSRALASRYNLTAIG